MINDDKLYLPSELHACIHLERELECKCEAKDGDIGRHFQTLIVLSAWSAEHFHFDLKNNITMVL
jgi:hypothetical protein